MWQSRLDSRAGALHSYFNNGPLSLTRGNSLIWTVLRHLGLLGQDESEHLVKLVCQPDA